MNKDNIRLGREYLYQQYNNSQYESHVKPAIDRYRDLSDLFSKNMDLCRNGAKLFYDSKSHKFFQGFGNCSAQNEFVWRRDHILYRIREFSAALFGSDAEKQECVKAYLYHKLGVQSEQDYIHSGEVNDDKIWKLFGKLEEKRFLTCEEKERKQAYLASDEYKIEVLTKELEEIQKGIQEKEEYFFQTLINEEMLNGIIERIEERLKKGISSIGRESLQNVLQAIKEIRKGRENDTSLSEIKFQMLFENGNNYRNCLNKYDDIDRIYECLEELDEKFLIRRNEINEQLSDLQEKPLVHDAPDLDLVEDLVDDHQLPSLNGAQKIEEKEELNDLQEKPPVHDAPDLDLVDDHQLPGLNGAQKIEEEEELNDRREDPVEVNAERKKKISWFSGVINAIGGFFRSAWNGFLNLFFTDKV
ncbi:putative uncharacterized protein [Waddlia chondrophila 2032/99]|uniref:Uncharacterized protein n=1 Tax=Waddlia chondrophila 2032/99 TaxID=765953 RepID=F8LEX8_9BACT|nr:putative uncharacterized protein [Waddlia chondrophila 2032/99]